MRTVAGRLGHADASVTLRVYAHALEARDRDMAQVLSSAVLGTTSQGADGLMPQVAVERGVGPGHA